MKINERSFEKNIKGKAFYSTKNQRAANIQNFE
jgi:hypothetical protein